jgi:hypothetical protein
MAKTSASATNTQYSVYIVSNKIKYDVTNALLSLDFSEQEKQMAVSVTIDLCDVDVNGKPLSSLLALPDSVSIYANDGTTNENVFMGYIWDISPKNSLEDDNITIKCYDKLVYWQESEDAVFFVAGRKTTSILSEVAKSWGFSLTYEYEDITHEQLVLRGAIADFITADVLDPIQRSTGKKYVIRDEKGKIYIRRVGQNQTVYTISQDSNVTEVRRYMTLNGVVTQVIVLGTADDDGKSPIEAVAAGKTSQYGTLQKIITKNEDTDIKKSKDEAFSIIENEGVPKWEYDIKAVNIPWIRKGDKVKVETAKLNGHFIVKSVSRDISNRGQVMTLTVADV